MSNGIVECLDSGRVKVLLLPLNKFPENSSFETYLTKFNKLKRADLSKFTLKQSDGKFEYFIIQKSFL